MSPSRGGVAVAELSDPWPMIVRQEPLAVQSGMNQTVEVTSQQEAWELLEERA